MTLRHVSGKWRGKAHGRVGVFSGARSVAGRGKGGAQSRGLPVSTLRRHFWASACRCNVAGKRKGR